MPHDLFYFVPALSSLAESDSDNEQNAVVHDMMSRVAEQAGVQGLMSGDTWDLNRPCILGVQVVSRSNFSKSLFSSALFFFTVCCTSAFSIGQKMPKNRAQSHVLILNGTSLVVVCGGINKN